MVVKLKNKETLQYIQGAILDRLYRNKYTTRIDKVVVMNRFNI